MILRRLRLPLLERRAQLSWRRGNRIGGAGRGQILKIDDARGVRLGRPRFQILLRLARRNRRLFNSLREFRRDRESGHGGKLPKFLFFSMNKHVEYPQPYVRAN